MSKIGHPGSAVLVSPADALRAPPDTEIDNLMKVIGPVAAADIDSHRKYYGNLTDLLVSRLTPMVTQQVTGLLIKTYVSPFTQFLLPIRQLGAYESINLKWMEINFDHGLAPQVEMEGLARLYTHSKTKRGARAVRRGVAVKIESGFFMTPEGREEWRMQIEQLATVIQRTNEYDVMMTLLNTPMANAVYGAQKDMSGNSVYGAGKHLSFEARLKLQIEWFGIVNKSVDSRGFSNMCTTLRTTMARDGVEPDAMVVPPNMLGFYYTSNNDTWEYNSAGPAVAANRKKAEDIGNQSGMRLETIQGLKLVDTYVQRMAPGSQEEAGDLLTVPTQIGEFYPVSTENLSVSSKMVGYTAAHRDVRIYNEDHGRMVTVKYDDCLQNCLRWDGDVLTEKGYDGEDTSKDMFRYTDGGVVKTTNHFCQMGTTVLHPGIIDRVLNSVLNVFTPENRERIRLVLQSEYKKNNGGGDGGEDDGEKKVDKKAFLADVLSGKLNMMGITGAPGALAAFNENWLDTKLSVDFDGGVAVGKFKQLESMPILERFIVISFLLTPIHLSELRKMHRNDIYVPIDFILCRPYMTYNTSSVIVMKAGSDTGETVVGQQKFEMTSNVADRTLYANYFYYGKAVVKKERNVIVAPHVFIQNYLSGNNTSFVDETHLPQIKQMGGLLDSTASLLCFAVIPGEDVAKHNIIDIRGRHTEMNAGATFFSSAAYYANRLDIDENGVAPPLIGAPDYEDRSFLANTLCCLGHTESSTRQVIHLNTGHLGPNTYDQIDGSRRPGHYDRVSVPGVTMRTL
jgi:hypothetical protein